MAFKMRTSKPEAGNKYYITKANGGYSDAIKGNPTDKDCDVLSNCVGYAYGRFNEIGGYGYCKYLCPVNAENFIQYKGTTLETGQTPKLGACMVWQKGATLNGSDGAGHVAIVEKVVSDTEVCTSESGWGSSTPFWNKTRTKGNGNWGQGTAYKFLGFIYNPAVQETKKETTDMSYTNSSLVSYTKLSPNHSGQRTQAIDRITPHCVVGQCSVETLGNIFAPTSKQASCNYGIGVDGRVGMYVEEKNRSWCSSSAANDQRAVTIECASDTTAPYAFKDVVYNKLIELCVDICKRNGKNKLLWLEDKTKTLNYTPKSGEMVLTVHRWFANKSCPGDWMYARMGDLATKVTQKLSGGTTDTGKTDTPTSDTTTLYRVQTGAFAKKANADAFAEKLEAAGFSTYTVQIGGLYKVQVGAFAKKANAEAMMAKLKAAGYPGFITTQTTSTTKSETAKKTAAEIAKEIFCGTCSDSRWSTWGNGATRTSRLTQAGYDPAEVQAEVNKLF